jgi:hypothetical protein
MDSPDDAIVRPQGDGGAIRALHCQRHISPPGDQRICFGADNGIQIMSFGAVGNDDHPVAVNLTKPDPPTVDDSSPILFQSTRVKVDGEIPI